MEESPLVNTTISHYRILAKIGEGGMGEVYRALDTELHRPVALKFLRPEVASDEKRMQRFIQEARAASALNHPNILTVYEIGQGEGARFFATEFVDGVTLRAALASHKVSLIEVLDVMIQIASALVAAHTAGIVHRDIKPENIMLRCDGIVKVLDFGLAKLTEREPSESVDTQAPTRFKTDPGTVVGTAVYMSPEQARGMAVDARTDIFSLGVTLYETVAGRLPFEGSSSSEVLASILSDKEPQPLARYSREVPLELERIVFKALRKDRDERYQTAKDMLLDLKTLKQELEFERKLERSVPPQAEASAEANQVAEPTIRVLPSRASTNGKFAPAISARATSVSSVEYIVSGIKRHKLGVAIVVALVITVGFGIVYFRQPTIVKIPIESIAVLPFENMTHDQNTEYMSDGVTESLINSLSQLPHIKVIARSSVFRYKNQTPDLQQVARQLNVQAVLTGRVLVQGDTLSVSVEMTDTQDNTQLWGQHYTRKAADIFSVQDEIARQVTDTLRVRLTGGQQEQVTKRYTENAEAYRLYLQGRYYMNGFAREENLNRAVSFFDQAIALDPRYALAYASRGESFFDMGDLILPMSEAMRKAKQDAAAALSIDDKLVEARTILANIEFQYDWDFARAEEDFKQVIALNPNYAEAHHQYGAFYLPLMGRPQEGVAEMRLAQQLDPVNPGIILDTTLPYYFARQYDQSIAQTRKAIEMSPNFFLPHMALGQALFQKGDYSVGIEEFEKAKAMEPIPLSIGALGYAYAKSGRKDEARKLLADLKELSKRRYVAPYWIAMIYVGLDEKDGAFAWLEKAYQERSWFLVWIKMDPMVDSLRSDARFTDLMRRIGFPV